jgi:hypothetical protein
MSTDYPYQVAGQNTDGLFGYEYHIDSDTCYRVIGLSYIEGFNFCDELEAGDDWMPVMQRWALGYRNDAP